MPKGRGFTFDLGNHSSKDVKIPDTDYAFLLEAITIWMLGIACPAHRSQCDSLKIDLLWIPPDFGKL